MLRQELEDILTNGTDEEKEVVALTLAALRRKRERGSAYISGFLGLEGTFIAEDTYQFIVPITPFMLNSMNMVHGGITATLADCTMGSLINKSLPTGTGVVTTEMKVNYIAPGKGKELISTAKLLSLGKHLCVAECKIENDEGRLIAVATGSFFIINQRNKS